MSWEIVGIFAALIFAALVAGFAGFLATSWWEARKGVILQEQSSDAELRRTVGLVKTWLEEAKYILENPPVMGFDRAPAPDFHLFDISHVLAQEGLFEGVVRDAIKDARKALFDAHRLIEEYHVRDVVLSRQFGDCFKPVKNEAISALDKALKYLD